jgi:hypothetical protein
MKNLANTDKMREKKPHNTPTEENSMFSIFPSSIVLVYFCTTYTFLFLLFIIFYSTWSLNSGPCAGYAGPVPREPLCLVDCFLRHHISILFLS